MEKFYKQVTFDLIELIRQSKLERAINLGNWILQKGIRTDEIIVSLSLAIRKLSGVDAAIQFLKSQHRPNYPEQYQRENFVKKDSGSILMSFSLSQYFCQKDDIEGTLQLLDEILTKGDHESSHCLASSLGVLCKNYRGLIVEGNYHQMEPNAQRNIESLVFEINQICTQYNLFQQKVIRQKLVTKEQKICEYGRLFLAFEEQKNKILESLAQHLKSVQKHKLVNQAKFVGNKFHSKMQESRNFNHRKKELFFKDVAEKSNDLMIPKPPIRKNYQQKYAEADEGNIQIENLKLLLKNVMGFINYLKTEIERLESHRKSPQKTVEADD